MDVGVGVAVGTADLEREGWGKPGYWGGADAVAGGSEETLSTAPPGQHSVAHSDMLLANEGSRADVAREEPVDIARSPSWTLSTWMLSKGYAFIQRCFSACTQLCGTGEPLG